MQEYKALIMDRAGDFNRIATVESVLGFGNSTLASLKGERIRGQGRNVAVSTDRAVRVSDFLRAYADTPDAPTISVTSVGGTTYNIPHETAAEIHADL